MTNQDRSTNDFGDDTMLSSTTQYHEDYDPFHRTNNNELFPDRSDDAWDENQQLYQDIFGHTITPRYTWYPDIIPHPAPDDISIGSTDTTTTCDLTIATTIGDTITPPENVDITSTAVVTNSNIMYHNPHYLGTLNYYFPPRLQQVNTSPNTDMNDIQPIIHNDIPPTDSSTTYSRRFHQTTLDDNIWDSFQDSCNNLKPNEPWGDDYSIKHSNSFRIYFQNVNSLGLSSDKEKFSNILSSMIKSECDIINWAQTSLNWKLLHTRNKVHETIRATKEIYKVNIGRNKYISPSPVIPGGTAQLIRGDWTGRIVELVHDFRLLGRWCGVKLRLKHDRHLYVISAYRVCDQSMSQIGPETAFGQQAAFLNMEGITTNPRQQFITDLTSCVKEWRKDLDDVMILLDANQDLTPSSGPSLTTLMRDCQLIDLFHHHHGTRPTFPTYDLGSKRLDYAIGTATLSPYVIKCGYLPFYLGVSSDHRGLFIDLSTEIIDGLTRLEAIPRRQLNSAFPKDVYKYKQYLEKEFISHNIYQKAEDLYTMADLIKADDPTYQQALSDLDKIIVNMQLLAESKCCRQRSPFDFSEDIHYTKIIINYWNIKRKEFTRNRSVSTITDNIYNQLPLEHQQFIDSATGFAITNWIKSKRRLRAMMALLKQNRAQEQQALVDNEAAYKSVPTDQIMKKNLRRQQDKKLFNTLRSHFHPNNRSGLSHIIVPENDKDGIPTDDVD